MWRAFCIGAVGAMCKPLAAAVSVLSSMDRGVEWDFQPIILLYFIHNLAGLTFDRTKRFRLCEHGRGLSLSECIALGVKLHHPRSRSHRSMTKNSIEGLVMQRPGNIYISAGFYSVWISWGEPHKLKVVGWAGKSHHRVQAAEHSRWLTEVLTVIVRLSCPGIRVPMIVCLCLCHRGPDPSWFPHHRHGAPAEGCGKNTHCYDAVCS